MDFKSYAFPSNVMKTSLKTHVLTNVTVRGTASCCVFKYGSLL